MAMLQRLGQGMDVILTHVKKEVKALGTDEHKVKITERKDPYKFDFADATEALLALKEEVRVTLPKSDLIVPVQTASQSVWSLCETQTRTVQQDNPIENPSKHFDASEFEAPNTAMRAPKLGKKR